MMRLALLLLTLFALPAMAATTKVVPAPLPPPTYAELARLTVENPVVVRAEVRRQSVAKVAAGEAPLPPGHIRLLLQARVTGVLAAAAAVPETITIIWQGPSLAKGKAPRFVKRQGLFFLSAARDRDDLFGLASAANILPSDAVLESRVKSIAAEARGPQYRDLRLTGISEAFSQPDEPPYARRTVFFLTTRSGKPVSLYLRAHGDDPQRDLVLFTTSDFIANVAPVQPETLAWFFLACALPRTLPPAVLAAQPSEADASYLAADFERVFAKLGTCS
jgi:hypothetical protein